MKTMRFMSALFLSIYLLSSIPTAARAEDPLKVGPDVYRLIFENDRVRVMEVDFKPGSKIGEHSHPDHFVYVTSPGTLKISKPDGTSAELKAELGQVLWIDAESHWAENIGTTEVKALIVELKEPKPASK
jgi:quercetin dioxygenase-like cupin family protein